MHNLYRGEVSLTLGDVQWTLRLSLQALAEIEAAFGVNGLAELGARFGAGGMRSADLVALLGALVRGGGERIPDTALAQHIEAKDLPVILEAIGKVFERAFPDEGETLHGQPPVKGTQTPRP